MAIRGVAPPGNRDTALEGRTAPLRAIQPNGYAMNAKRNFRPTRILEPERRLHGGGGTPTEEHCYCSTCRWAQALVDLLGTSYESQSRRNLLKIAGVCQVVATTLFRVANATPAERRNAVKNGRTPPPITHQAAKRARWDQCDNYSVIATFVDRAEDAQHQGNEP